MAHKLLLVLAACLALSSARVRREAASSTALQDIEKHAQQVEKTLSEQFQALANSPSTQQLQQALKDGSDTILQQLAAYSTSLQGALSDASGKAKEALSASQAQVSRAAEELRQSHPELQQQAQQLRERLQAAVQTALQQSQLVAREVAANVDQTNQKLAPQLKEAYDQFVKHATDVQQKLHEAANAKQ